MPSRSQVLAALRPNSMPPLPVSVLIPSKPPVKSTSSPLAPSASEAPDKSTKSITSPWRVSAPDSPSIAPVSVASTSKTSSPAPPLRLKLLATVTLNVSWSVPPLRFSTPLKVPMSVTSPALVAVISQMLVPSAWVIVSSPVPPVMSPVSVAPLAILKVSSPVPPVRFSVPLKSMVPTPPTFPESLPVMLNVLAPPTWVSVSSPPSPSKSSGSLTPVTVNVSSRSPRATLISVTSPATAPIVTVMVPSPVAVPVSSVTLITSLDSKVYTSPATDTERLSAALADPLNDKTPAVRSIDDSSVRSSSNSTAGAVLSC